MAQKRVARAVREMDCVTIVETAVLLRNIRTNTHPSSGWGSRVASENIAPSRLLVVAKGLRDIAISQGRYRHRRIPKVRRPTPPLHAGVPQQARVRIRGLAGVRMPGKVRDATGGRDTHYQPAVVSTEREEALDHVECVGTWSK
jgi:hypothetical protein